MHGVYMNNQKINKNVLNLQSYCWYQVIPSQEKTISYPNGTSIYWF